MLSQPHSQSETQPALIEARHLAKNFGAVQALRDGNLSLRQGEIHAIVGDNGAGKSTLVKMFAGVFPPDSGEIFIRGRRVSFKNPREAEEEGVASVYQSLALVDHLDITANFFLGNEIRFPPPLSWFGVLWKRKMRARAASDVQRLNIGVRSVDELVKGLSGGQRQSIAVARAVARGRQILIMDEPTAALGVRESAHVHDIIRRCRDEGMGIILISHNLEEVFYLADRISVFRLGQTIACVDRQSSKPSELVELITGARDSDGGSSFPTKGVNQ